MTQRIRALNAYRPRIEYGGTLPKEQLLKSIARITFVSERMLDFMIQVLRDQILEFCCTGRVVNVDGLGTFAPNIDLDGNLSISFRPDRIFAKRLNERGAFQGTIVNRRNIGKTSDELVALWNGEHPEDPVASKN